MVGGEDYDKSAFNLATQGHRQPGSSFKPFTLVTALSQGRSQYDIISSQPKQFPFTIKVSGKHGKDEFVHDLFDVNNYDDVYGGSYTIRDGTTYSDNSVYAELGLNAGVSNVAKTAERMGIDSDLSTANEYRIDGGIGDGKFHPYNPALILGGLENGVTPLEISHAYETLAEGGKRITGTLAASNDGPVAIRRVQSDGDVVDTNDGTSGENKTEGHQVIDAGVAATAKSILETVVQSGTGRLANTGDPGEFGRPAPPRTTATHGSAARPRGSPPAYGWATPTPTSRWRRSTTAARSTAGHPGAHLARRRGGLRRAAGCAEGGCAREEGRPGLRRRDRHDLRADHDDLLDDAHDDPGGAPGDRHAAGRQRRAAGRQRQRRRRRRRHRDGLGRSGDRQARLASGEHGDGPREVGAPGGAEAPGQLRRLGDSDPRRCHHLDVLPVGVAGEHLERRLRHIRAVRARGRSRAPRSACPGPSTAHSSARRRLRRISFTPQRGSSARIRTAAAQPSGSATKLRRLWMP